MFLNAFFYTYVWFWSSVPPLTRVHAALLPQLTPRSHVTAHYWQRLIADKWSKVPARQQELFFLVLDFGWGWDLLVRVMQRRRFLGWRPLMTVRLPFLPLSTPSQSSPHLSPCHPFSLLIWLNIWIDAAFLRPSQGISPTQTQKWVKMQWQRSAPPHPPLPWRRRSGRSCKKSWSRSGRGAEVKGQKVLQPGLVVSSAWLNSG